LHAKTNTDKKAEKKKESFSESVASIAAVFVSGLFIITFIFQAFVIPSGSMENTLLVGDHVFVDRLTPAAKPGYTGPILPYREIKRGDIIVFLSPVQPGLFVVKRVMGIPGDRIHLKNGVVYRNGVALNEPYVLHDNEPYNPYRDEFPSVPAIGMVPLDASEWPMVLKQNIQDGDLVVPPGDYFGMGDHRSVSLDSRFWGFIPRENIVGRPLFIYWSFVTPSDQYEHTETSEQVKFFLHVVVHFFDQTRWNRMFHLAR
jgi:signal peptidase I